MGKYAFKSTEHKKTVKCSASLAIYPLLKYAFTSKFQSPIEELLIDNN